jgi:uncharacterized FAD-dependent dehydrogenase
MIKAEEACKKSQDTFRQHVEDKIHSACMDGKTSTYIEYSEWSSFQGTLYVSQFPNELKSLGYEVHFNTKVSNIEFDSHYPEGALIIDWRSGNKNNE